MAALEKLEKALDSLKKAMASPASPEFSSVRNKEKMSLCQLVGDIMCSQDVCNATNFVFLFSYTMETLFEMCDDQDSVVRMIADESLNRIIRVQMQNNIIKVNLELHKEIKKNRSARSLRAALWRFAELSRLIRPSKGRPFIQSLIPCFIAIANRPEETVLETLAAALPKILSSLGCFMTDNDAKQLISVFMKHIHSDNPAFRRSATSSIVAVCLHCAKPQYFTVHTITSLLELALPVKNDLNASTILGVLNCLRGLIPHILDDKQHNYLGDSFGKRKTHKQSVLSSDSIVQMYELCLHCTHHSDHNVVTAALETLKELFSTPPKGLVSILLDSQGLCRSRIHTSPALQPAKSHSDISVTSFGTVDDSQLLDTDVIMVASKDSAWLQVSNPEDETSSMSDWPFFTPPINRPLDSLSDYPDSESLTGEDIEPFLKPEVKPSTSDLEDVFEDRDSSSPLPASNFKMHWDIGNVAEKGLPAIIYCTRRLVTAFLVPECSNVRVSHRALALLCLGQICNFYPKILTLSVDKKLQQTPLGFAFVYDVMRLSNHSDPQLRGLVRTFIGNAIRSILDHGNRSISSWLPKGLDFLGKPFDIQVLVSLQVEGLGDESAVAIRHSLIGIELSLSSLLESDDSALVLPIFDKLLTLVDNSYWLIKSKLVELLCSLSYSSIYYITGSNRYQDTLLESIIPACLSSDDGRVRRTAAQSLVKLVNNLYVPNEEIVVDTCSKLSFNLFADIYNFKREMKGGKINELNQNLSRIVELLMRHLSLSTSKYLSYGCIESLAALSLEYNPIHHAAGWWGTCGAKSVDQKTSSNGILCKIVALLTQSPVSLDLECHRWLLLLAGNMFDGFASSLENSDNLDEINELSEALLIHVARILNMFVRVTEFSAYQLRHFGLSPLRLKVHKSPAHAPKLPDEENKEDRKRFLGSYTNNRHWLKFMEIISSGYSNYKLTLDPAGSEKLVSLISQTLICLKQLLLHLTLANHAYVTEELLNYLGHTFSIDSTSTICVVNQLMRNLFEIKSEIPVTIVKRGSDNDELGLGLYVKTIEKPLQVLTAHVQASQTLVGSREYEEDEVDKEVTAGGIKEDREELARKIKLFEGIVIHALKEYTITSNVNLQVEVLALLIQLVDLKVNYCLLDSGQIFIKFVKEQLQFIEAGQIQSANLLVPQIFKFLVHLSNDKNHSKPVISIPEIIQLCDGLMASGRNPVTHCIPALLPIIDHVFHLTPFNVDNIDLLTQKEVILAKLFRMAEYPEVLDVLNNVMKDSWKWEEHWKPWHQSIVKTIWPLLAEGKLLVKDINVLYSLLSPNNRFAVPLNEIIDLLFTHKQDGQTVNQWLSLVTTMLLLICKYQEEIVLLHLEEVNLYVREEGDDPLKVNTVSKTLPPQHLIAKLLMRIIRIAVTSLRSTLEESGEPEQLAGLEKTFATFLMCCIYLFKEGNYNKLNKSLTSLLINDGGLKSVHKHFIFIAYRCPILVILYAEILMLLNVSDVELWGPLMQPLERNATRLCLKSEIVKQGSTMAYCEYLSKNQHDIKMLQWALDTSVEDIINNITESPVKKLMFSIGDFEEKSELLLNAVSRCINKAEIMPVFAHRLLKTLEYVHPNLTGAVLNLVALSLTQNKNIAIARLATAFCCRTIECMLVFEKPQTCGPLNKDGIVKLLNALNSNQKHFRSGLINTLKKLGEDKYQINWEPNDVSLDFAALKTLKPDKDWLVDQVKRRCCNDFNADGVRCTRLLRTLDEDELETMFLSDHFDKSILQHCFTVQVDLTSTLAIENLPTVFRCARKVLMKYIHEICDALPSAYNEIKSNDVGCYEFHLETLIHRLNFQHQLIPLALAINNYFLTLKSLQQSCSNLDVLIPSNSHLDLMRFSLLCMKASIALIGEASNPSTSSMNDIEHLVESSCRVLSFHILASLLKMGEINIILNCIAKLIEFISGEQLPFYKFQKAEERHSIESDNLFSQVSTTMVFFLNWFENCPSQLPKRVESSFKALIVSLGRIRELNACCKFPVEIWKNPDEKSDLPFHLLRDPEILTQMINRTQILGWKTRMDFEDTWASLLNALTIAPDIDNIDQEEISIIMHTNSLVIDVLTWLLLSTLSTNKTDSYQSKLLHIPRSGNHKLYQLHYWNRLEEMNNLLCWKLKLYKWGSPVSIIDKRPNLERIHHRDGYGFGQLSVNFLQTKITLSNESPSEESAPQGQLPGVRNSVDVRSCLQFILELYAQWILPNSGISLNLQLSMIKSIACLSDLFCETGHFEWMFDTFLSLHKSHPAHDEILHQYLIIGILKSAAVLQIVEGDKSEEVIQIVEAALNNPCTSIQSAGIHGVLYLLQSVINIKKLEGELPKLSAQEFKSRLMALCNDFIAKEFVADKCSVDLQLLITLCTYLMEALPDDVNSTQKILQNYLLIARKTSNKCIYQTTVYGLERLVLTGNHALYVDSITHLALEKFLQSDPSISLPALQLLLACIYSGKTENDRQGNESDDLSSDTDIMEKTTSLFDKIKKGYPIEVEVVCEVLPTILSDFFPVLDVPTKVIFEFLSPNQPHTKNMANMVFQVFNRACKEQHLTLLQDWVVDSLNNFTSNLSLKSVVWSLCCFFISCSENPWLRAIFPHVQSRIGQCELEDKEIFCIAAIQFYEQLSHPQREIFVESFKKSMTCNMSPFADVLACLS